MTRTRPHRGRLLALAAVLALGACAEPTADQPGQGRAAENPLGSQEPDHAREALREEVTELGGLLTTARDHLEDAAGADDPGQVRDAVGSAIELLIGDPADGTAPLFPVELGERGSGSERADRLTSALTVAREAGGPAGREVRELLRDLVAGDLGAWQRDPEGMLAMAEGATAGADTLEEIEAAVFELPGEATRAVAWATLAEEEGDLATAREYAERATTHLDVAVTAVGELDLDELDLEADLEDA